jgi:aminoglycoside phosphotransferase (APT) family kinase protein
VAGVGATLAEIRRHAQASALLAEVGVGVPGVVEAGVVASNGLIVSVWQWVEHTEVIWAAATIGELLAKVHSAPVVGLAAFDPLGITRRRVAAASELTTGDEQAVLEGALVRAEQVVAGQGVGVRRYVHGDFVGANLLNGRWGPVVIDFENSGVGDPIWDLVNLAHQPKRFPGRSDGYFDELLEAYRRGGGKVDEAELVKLFCVVDVRAAAWTVVGRALDPWFWAESQIRLETLRNPDNPAHWTPR